MSWGTPDVYYQPEEFGLTQVGEIDWSDGCYQFDLTVVWQDKSGQFYIGDDSGCSCPSPFEYATSLDKLEKVSKFEVAERLQARLASEQGGYGTGENLDSKTAELISRVMTLGV